MDPLQAAADPFTKAQRTHYKAVWRTGLEAQGNEPRAPGCRRILLNQRRTALPRRPLAPCPRVDFLLALRPANRASGKAVAQASRLRVRTASRLRVRAASRRPERPENPATTLFLRPNGVPDSLRHWPPPRQGDSPGFLLAQLGRCPTLHRGLGPSRPTVVLAGAEDEHVCKNVGFRSKRLRPIWAPTRTRRLSSTRSLKRGDALALTNDRPPAIASNRPAGLPAGTL